MDYITKPTNRNEIRTMARIFGILFDLQKDKPVNPEYLLDRLHTVFRDTNYEIIDDEVLPDNVPAVTELTENGYMIKIKNSVLLGATERKVGGHRMHILHEIVHVFVDKMGFKPQCARTVRSKPIPAYMSLEWIVKAVSGEIMIPFEASKNMSVAQIMDTYGVSEAAAKQRLKIN